MMLLMVGNCLPTITYAGLTKPEEEIRSYIVSQEKAQIALLEKLVLINSGTTNVAGVKKVGAMMQKELVKLGFKTHWVSEPASMHRAGTLMAERKNASGKPILLIGHLDTVFASDSPFQKIKHKKYSIQGPGIIDDKGGLVVMLYALKALQSIHALDKKNITIVLTGDEEESGKPTSISRKPLMEAANGKEVALDFEPGMTQDTLSIARRGISNWEIIAHGNEAHSATLNSPDVGAGAAYELGRILQAFQQNFSNEKYLTVNPGRIAVGNVIADDEAHFKTLVTGKENVVAKIAIAHGDVRYLTNEQKDKFKQKAQMIIGGHLTGTHSSIMFIDGIPAMAPTDKNMQLLNQYSSVSTDLNLGKVTALDGGLRGAGDISYVAGMIPYNLVGLGPIGSGMHSVIESIELSSLPIQTQRAAILMYRL